MRGNVTSYTISIQDQCWAAYAWRLPFANELNIESALNVPKFTPYLMDGFAQVPYLIPSMVQEQEVRISSYWL